MCFSLRHCTELFVKTQRISQRGATLVEVIIATGVVGLVMTSAVAAMSVSLTSAVLAKSKSTATKYTQEGIEYFRTQRNLMGWESFVKQIQNSAFYCLATLPYTSTGGLESVPQRHCNSDEFVDSQGRFQREAEVAHTQSNGEDIITITVTVTWQQSGRPVTSNATVEMRNVLSAQYDPPPFVPSPFLIPSPIPTPSPSPSPTPIPTPSPSPVPTPSPSPSPTPHWSYRRTLAVNNSSGATQTAFQVQLTLDTATLITAGKLQSNCNDLRITDSDAATVLPFWIEPTTCNTSSTKVWVKVPSISTSGTTLYFYYGHDTATSGQAATTSVFIQEISGVMYAYNFDETTGTTVIDSSGSGANGTLSGTVLRCNYWFNGCYWFNGINTSIQVNANPPTGTADRTIGMWVAPYSGNNRSFFGYGASSSTNLLDLMEISNLVGIHWYGNNVTSQFPNMAPILGAWNYVVFTYGGGVINAYLNGTLRNSVSQPLNTSAVGYFRIGDGIYSTYRYFIGYIDDVRVYDRVLTSTEIANIYSGQGYVTPNYANKELVRKFNINVTQGSTGTEEAGNWTGL